MMQAVEVMFLSAFLVFVLGGGVWLFASFLNDLAEDKVRNSPESIKIKQLIDSL